MRQTLDGASKVSKRLSENHWCLSLAFSCREAKVPGVVLTALSTLCITGAGENLENTMAAFRQ